jgi:hypothetical protein
MIDLGAVVEREITARGNDEVIVRRREINMPWLDGLPLMAVFHVKRRMPLEAFAQKTRSGRTGVQHDQE